ncbi:hypothetical protein, partial [Bacteroides finegoldii]|uniref:hypothetical protein n=1 Tax=Bacteroides finegoldii TaxID=338188 RepID=UPI003977BA26
IRQQGRACLGDAAGCVRQGGGMPWGPERSCRSGIRDSTRMKKRGCITTGSGTTRQRWGCIFLLTPLDWQETILLFTAM